MRMTVLKWVSLGHYVKRLAGYGDHVQSSAVRGCRGPFQRLSDEPEPTTLRTRPSLHQDPERRPVPGTTQPELPAPEPVPCSNAWVVSPGRGPPLRGPGHRLRPAFSPRCPPPGPSEGACTRASERPLTAPDSGTLLVRVGLPAPLARAIFHFQPHTETVHPGHRLFGRYRCGRLSVMDLRCGEQAMACSGWVRTLHAVRRRAGCHAHAERAGCRRGSPSFPIASPARYETGSPKPRSCGIGGTTMLVDATPSSEWNRTRSRLSSSSRAVAFAIRHRPLRNRVCRVLPTRANRTVEQRLLPPPLSHAVPMR